MENSVVVHCATTVCGKQTLGTRLFCSGIINGDTALPNPCESRAKKGSLSRSGSGPFDVREAVVKQALTTAPRRPGKRPDEQAERREQHRHEEGGDAIGETHSSPNPKDIGH